jgi:hypothetical protein
VGRFLFIDDIEQAVGKSQDCTGVHPFGIYPGVFAEGKVCSVNQGHGINQEKFFLHNQYFEIYQ